MFKKLLVLAFVVSATACAVAPDADEPKESNGEGTTNAPPNDPNESGEEVASTSQAASGDCRWLSLECCNNGRNLRNVYQCKIAGYWTNIGPSKCQRTLRCAL